MNPNLPNRKIYISCQDASGNPVEVKTMSESYNHGMTIIACKQGNAYYRDNANNKIFHVRRNDDKWFQSRFTGKFEELDSILSNQGYRCMEGVLVDPIDNALVLNKDKQSTHLVPRPELEERLIQLMK